MIGLICGVVTAVVYLATSFLVRRLDLWARARRLLVYPREQGLHGVPVSRIGGVAIVATSLTTLLTMDAFLSDLGGAGILRISAGGILVAAVSLADDIWHVSPFVRLMTHTAVCLGIVLGIGHWQVVRVPGFGLFDLGVYAVPLTVVWVVGFINAYNFMDGIDGLAAGQTVVAGLGWALLGYLYDQPWLGIAGLVLSAAGLGFLRHNWHPASVFMGDVGAAYLGYMFAVLSVAGSGRRQELALDGVVVVWPFVFDSGLTLLQRLVRRENVFTPHRSHLYQRLITTGLSHRAVTTLYLVLSAVGVGAVLGFRVGSRGLDAVVLMTLAVAASALWLFVVWRERHSGPQVAKVVA